MKIGFANGCFDCLHMGHRHFLKECLAQCDHLIVAVNHDASVRALKGPDRPYQPLMKRIDALLGYLHHAPGRKDCSVVPFMGDADKIIEALGPDLVFRGEDQFGVGRHITIPVVRILRIPGFSTTSQAQRREPI